MMKSLLFFLLWGSMATLFAQEQLFLKDGQIIDPIQLHEIKSVSVVYAKDGSLHEVYKSEVLWIKNDSTTLSFDETGKAVYVYRIGKSGETNDKSKLLLTPRQGSLFVVPTKLLSPNPSFLAGIELKLTPRWSFVQQGGMVLWSFEGAPVRGNHWQSRTSLRGYLKRPFRFFHRPGRIYLEGEYIHKYQSSTYFEANSYEHEGGQLTQFCDYEERTVRISGLVGQAGIQWMFPNKLILEVWCGLGIQRIQSRDYLQSSQVLFQDGEEVDRWGEEVESRDSEFQPGLTSGVKVGIAL